MKDSIDTCLTGYGVSCGLEVQLNDDCSVQAAEGTLILPDGTIYHSKMKKFRYYFKPDKMDPGLKKIMLAWLKLKQDPGVPLQFLQLAVEKEDRDNIDPLKQQHPEDVPEHNLMWNKILVLVAVPGNEEKEDTFWVLVSRTAIAAAMKFDNTLAADDQSLFSRPVTKREMDIETIDGFLRPVINLPCLSIPRLGYKNLAITQHSLGLEEDNLHHPYQSLVTIPPAPPKVSFNSYAHLFFEYKAIVDDHVLELRKALKLLHDGFGPLLSHKGDAYLDRYRKILVRKLTRFYEEGEHLYYIQYIYDWFRDLTAAYNELVQALHGFKPGCPCAETNGKEETKANIVMLGPVLGGRTTYQPLIFRDLARAAEREERIRELRCLHWRLLMMIRTFDLPFLGMEQVLQADEGPQGIEEELDSSNYWEYLNSATEPHSDGEYNWLPVKFTPTRSLAGKLGRRAIPYYYPLDSNSVYSVHQFWDHATTVLRRTDTHLSYNAHPGDSNQPSTDPVNDSYSSRPEVLMPLVYDLQAYHWLRPEGHIGKRITIQGAAPNATFYFKSFPLFEYLQKYNLCVDVIAIGLPGGTGAPLLELLQGIEHNPALQQGHTLVLFFVDSETEQIELQECKKDTLPEIKRNIVVADFVLPYRFSCCGVAAVNTLALQQMPS